MLHHRLAGCQLAVPLPNGRQGQSTAKVVERHILGVMSVNIAGERRMDNCAGLGRAMAESNQDWKISHLEKKVKSLEAQVQVLRSLVAGLYAASQGDRK